MGNTNLKKSQKRIFQDIKDSLSLKSDSEVVDRLIWSARESGNSYEPLSRICLRAEISKHRKRFLEGLFKTKKIHSEDGTTNGEEGKEFAEEILLNFTNYHITKHSNQKKEFLELMKEAIEGRIKQFDEKVERETSEKSRSEDYLQPLEEPKDDSTCS